LWIVREVDFLCDDIRLSLLKRGCTTSQERVWVPTYPPWQEGELLRPRLTLWASDICHFGSQLHANDTYAEVLSALVHWKGQIWWPHQPVPI